MVRHIPLHTDLYEYTMLEAALESGVAHQKAVFELFTRKLPTDRVFGVVAGTQRAVEAILGFTFDKEDLDILSDHLKPTTIDWLEQYRFTGDVIGYREGDLFFPHSPILTIRATFAEAVLLETILLSIFNYDSAVAAAATILRVAAKDKGLSELGSRRVNEHAAVVAARAAYIAGFDSTSNVEAARQYPEIPVFGTSAHAFTLAHKTELEAFKSQVETFGVNTTILVDTYNIEQGITNALEVAGTALRAIRIDSGDPFVELPKARKQLDEAGAVNTRIVLSGDVDPESITAILDADLPIDSFGVGTCVVTGDGHPNCGFVYKLVAIQEEDGTWRDCAKTSSSKKSVGGEKTAYREYDENWIPVREVIAVDGYLGDHELTELEPLQVQYIAGGNLVHLPTLTEARELNATVREALPVTEVETVLVVQEIASEE